MFAVRNSLTCSGRGIFAVNHLADGSDVFVKRPKCCIPDDNNVETTCYSCLVSNIYHHQTLSVCTGCRIARYCSIHCQKKDWHLHKFECRPFKNASKRPTCMVRALVRVLAIRRVDESWFSDISSLMSHCHEIQQKDAVDVIPKLVALVSGEHNLTLIEETYCRFLTNSIQLTTYMGDAVGVCFDPLISLVNHSCNPNIILNHDGKKIIAKCLRDISPDEELYMPYIDITQSTALRRMDLQRYYFNCQCLGCASPPDHRDKFYCSNCPRPLDPFSSTCPSCHFGNSSYHLLRRLELEYTKLASTYESQEPCTLYSALNTLYVSGFATTRQPVPAIHHLLFLTHLSRSEFHNALIHSFVPLLYEIFPRPVTTVRLFATIKLALYIAAEEQDSNILRFAFSLLCECSKRAQKSHGKGTLMDEVSSTKEETREHLALRKGEEVNFQGYMHIVKESLNDLLQRIRQNENNIHVKFSL